MSMLIAGTEQPCLFYFFYVHATFKRSAKPLASRCTLDFLLRRLLRRRQEQGALQPSL